MQSGRVVDGLFTDENKVRTIGRGRASLLDDGAVAGSPVDRVESEAVWEHGEVVRVCKGAWPAGYRGMAADVTVTWNEPFGG
jgi:hypothetical protein